MRLLFTLAALLFAYALPAFSQSVAHREYLRSTHLQPGYDELKVVYFSSATNSTKVRVIGQCGANLFGIAIDDWSGTDAAHNSYVHSQDNGVTWTDTGAKAPVVTPAGAGQRVVQLLCLCANGSGAPYKFVVTSDAKIYRNIAGDWTSWHAVHEPVVGLSTGFSPPIPANQLARTDSLTASNFDLFFGNYNADETDPLSPAFQDAVGVKVWRSQNCGTSWHEVFSISKLTARHVHAVSVDPANAGVFQTLPTPNTPAHIYLSVGDGGSGGGLYRSTSNGDTGTWEPLANNRYGINIAFAPTPPATAAGPMPRILLEGDGKHEPHVIGLKSASGFGAGSLEALIWPEDYAVEPESQKCEPNADLYKKRSWAGGGSAIKMTSHGDLFYFSMGEWQPAKEGSTTPTCAIGGRNGVWIARGPHFTSAVLLHDATNLIETMSPGKTIEAGGYLYNDIYKIKVPQFKLKY